MHPLGAAAMLCMVEVLQRSLGDDMAKKRTDEDRSRSGFSGIHRSLDFVM